MKKRKHAPKRQKQASFFSTRQGKIVLLISALILLLIFFLRGPRGSVELYKNSQKKNQLEADIDQLSSKKTELDSEKVMLNDDDYIEKTAREQYNMKKQGEQVYKIEKDSN